MKLIDFLADSSSAYIKNDDRTMTIRNSSDGMVFTVYEIRRYARRIPILIETESEERAVAVLRGDDD